MSDTKITQLRNLMTPLVNYFIMINNKECSDKALKFIEHDKKQSITNLPKIREILAQITDDWFLFDKIKPETDGLILITNGHFVEIAYYEDGNLKKAWKCDEHDLIALKDQLSIIKWQYINLPIC